MHATTEPAAADPASLARSFQALADEKRLRVLELLGGGELCVCELAEALDVSQPLLSFHLRTLREAGLVNATRKGRWVHYSLNRDAVVELGRAAEALSRGTCGSDDETGRRKAWSRCCRPGRST